MTTTYKIHPAIGIARLGNSPEDFYIAPEKPAALPIACDAQGNPLLSPDGTSELTVKKFKDEEGRIKRQAARFQLYVYDDESPEGRPLKIGDPISGGGNQGVLTDIQWRVYLANKKAPWYEFKQLQGEHGYKPGHPRRNSGITDTNARQCLIIDPGPRIVSHKGNRTARFDRDGGDVYAHRLPLLRELEDRLQRLHEQGARMQEMEGWAALDPWDPYTGWVNRTGSDLDRGVLSNVLGGAFCPGGEVGWILRNPAIYVEPYRIKADPRFAAFRQTAAEANNNSGAAIPEADYSAYVDATLSQKDNFDRGMQPGDLTKHMALPWQADFNECTTQPINVTYEEWNKIYPANPKDSLMRREQAVWETLWWPAHRPLQVFEAASGSSTVDWSRGIPQTNAGDLKMVTAWWTLPFVVKNPQSDDEPSEVPPPSPLPYVAVERTEIKEEP